MRVRVLGSRFAGRAFVRSVLSSFSAVSLVRHSPADLVLVFGSPSPAGSAAVRSALAGGVPVRVFSGGFCSFASGAVPGA